MRKFLDYPFDDVVKNASAKIREGATTLDEVLRETVL